MVSLLRPALALLLSFTLLTGVCYPAAVTGLAQLAFSGQANGSLIRVGDVVVGSSLIGQPFDDPAYFSGRPSATAPVPCNGAASSGSNLGPMNPALHEAVAERVLAFGAGVPVDLVTASGSGLDPHISPAAAYFQAPSVARARGMSEAQVRELVDAHVEGRTLGLLGEPRVNVLRLNLALDALAGH